MINKQKTWQGNSSKRRNSTLFIFIFLGMLTAFAPFVTDMYLPGLPEMSDYFKTSAPMVQLGLTFSMLGLALGQIIFGPLSDKYGRRKPLLISMVLFLVSTAACIFAPSIEIFVALRLLQGIAAAGGIVIARSIASDKFKGANLAKALAVVGAINGIAPIVAPIIGGAVLDHIGWRGIFVILFVLGIALSAQCLHFAESLSKKRRSKEKLAKTLKLFKAVLSNRKFVFYVLQLAFATAVLFAYISASPFIIQKHYGFSPLAFSFFFAANSIAIGAGSLISAKFKSMDSCILISCAGMTLLSFIILAAFLLNASIIVFEGLLLVLLFMLGLTFTASTTIAMQCERRRAGTASALLGAAGFLFGSAVSPIVGLGNILTSTALTFIVCALLSSLCAFFARRQS